MAIANFQKVKILGQQFIKKLGHLLLGIVLSMAVLMVSQQININEKVQIEQLIQQEANAIGLEISKELSNRIIILKLMANRWQVSGGTAKEIWETDAKTTINNFAGEQAIAWIDPSFQVQWVVPQAGNQALQNLDLSQKHPHQTTLQIARDFHQIMISHQISLGQEEKSFLIIFPLFVGNKFDGFLIEKVQFKSLFDHILKVPYGYNIEIYDGLDLIYTKKIPVQTSLEKTVIIKDYNADWRITVLPTLELIAATKSPWSMVVLIGGLFLVWLVVLVEHGSSKIARNIAERKKVEIALEKELLQTKTLFQTSRDGIVVMDHQGKVIDASPSFAKMLGYTVEETLNLSIGDWNVQWTKEKLQNIFTTEEMIPLLQTRYLRKDRAEYDVEISWNRVELEGEKVHFCICRDISDRKQADEILRHQKELLQTVIERIPVMIALFNREGQIEFINPEMERLLGWSLQDWQQKDILAKCYPDPLDCQKVKENMRLATGQWQDLTTYTATTQKLETSWANVQLSGGYYLAIGQDISDRKQAEAALRDAIKAAEAANLAKSIFLANMSHELRTPLNVILGFAQVMAYDSSLTPTQQEDLQTIRRSGDHLLNLINDILDLSKIESGHSTIDESGFDLIALLHSLRNMFAERASSKGLDICLEIAPEVAQFIITDVQKLRQVLLNLLSNAIKFTEQGSITLQVNIDANDPETAPITRLKFVVSDTGVGIALEELNAIFDAFVQAQAGKRLASGTGLGLTISRKLLQLMGGDITVSSTLGVGTTFTFTLPVRSTVAMTIADEQSDPVVIKLAPGQLQRRILVVDDRPENRLLMVKIMAQIGLKVREASDGEEAIALAQEWQPDLIWMDIRMPGLDGYEATRQIRRQKGGQKPIIIAISAQVSQTDHARALAAGCNDYISKPFQEKLLFLKMAEYLGLEYISQGEKTPTGEQISNPSHPRSSVNSDFLDLKSLKTLPENWLVQLENAAVCGNDGEIVALAAQLPPEMARLTSYLIELADKYQFEQIIKLVSVNTLWEI